MGANPAGSRGELKYVPHPLPIGRDRAGNFRQQAVGFRAVIIPECWAESSRNDLGEFPKAEPRLVRCTGAPRVAREIGGLKSQRDSRENYRQP